MKPYEIENWAIRVIERVEANQPNEDVRVELKSDWPEPTKAARRIAAHANSVGGEHILWLIGVDEKSGVVVGARHEEFSNWYSKVRAQFDEMFAPSVVNLNVPLNRQTVVALLFETDRVPYVVRNPAFGKVDGGPVSLEVPWRDGTSVRSATRRDLLRVLTPLQLIPDCEIHNTQLFVKRSVSKERKKESNWTLVLTLFVIPKTEARIIIPEHRCSGWFKIKGRKMRENFDTIELTAYKETLIRDVGEGISIEGPGILHIEAKATTKAMSRFSTDAELFFALRPIGTENIISINMTLPLSNPVKDADGRWSYKPERKVGYKLLLKKIVEENS
jgi:hypothetical protein